MSVYGEVGDFITLAADQLRATSPRFGAGINDANGNELISLTTVVNAANEISVSNNTTSNNPIVATSGSDSNISLTVNCKGTGVITLTSKILFNTGTTATDNLIFVNSTSSGAVNASFGFFVAGVGSQTADDGPYFLARGNTFTNISNQKGTVLFVAGNPNSPGAREGALRFYTGAEVERVRMVNNGDIFQYAKSSAPTDGDMFNSSICFYLDEAGNNLKVRVKYSDGTLKTATIALA